MILGNHMMLAGYVVARRPDVVLFDCFSELLAPLWFWPHWLVSRFLRVRYALTIHDPERRASFGPGWWHRLSVRVAYAPFSAGLVHDIATLRPGWVPDHIALREAPHGVFGLPAANETGSPRRTRPAARKMFGLDDNVITLLAFGYVADRKNLDLAIAVVARMQRVHLVIAGLQASAADKPVAHYRSLAARLRVTDRVSFVERYVADREVGDFFEAADIVLLTYASEFVSQSGVLHLAANWDKPVLASAGPGPLIEAIRRFRLGVVVEPDSVDALVAGLQRILAGDLPPGDWDGFRREASWALNIDRLLEAILAASACPVQLRC